jgi:hypothetical protein
MPTPFMPPLIMRRHKDWYIIYWQYLYIKYTNKAFDIIMLN